MTCFGRLLTTGEKQAKRNTETYLSYQVTIAFTIRHPYTGEDINIKDDLERISIIRSRTSKKPILRPAVRMPLTIGGVPWNHD